MNEQHSKRNATAAAPGADSLPDARAEALARKNCKALWQTGSLVHMATRYPRRPKAPRVDRLAGILERGLVAPARCPDGLVRSDLNIIVTGSSLPYDSLVFLHQFGPQSYIYTICEPGRFAVFVDPALPVLRPEDMGDHWVVLCQDEVYVRDGVDSESLIGVAIHPADAQAVLRDLMGEFQRVGIPLYDYDGNILWPTCS